MKALKIAVVLPLFLVTLISISGQLRPDEWYRYTSQVCHFTILFPGTPTEEIKSRPELKGLSTHIISYLDPSVTIVDEQHFCYGVTFMELPPSAVHSDSTTKIPEFFGGLINGLTGNGQGKLLSEISIEKDGYPGREIQVSIQEGTIIFTSRLYLIN